MIDSPTVKKEVALILAVLGTALVWLLRAGNPVGTVWPSVLATIGFWLLALLGFFIGRRR